MVHTFSKPHKTTEHVICCGRHCLKQKGRIFYTKVQRPYIIVTNHTKVAFVQCSGIILNLQLSSEIRSWYEPANAPMHVLLCAECTSSLYNRFTFSPHTNYCIILVEQSCFAQISRSSSVDYRVESCLQFQNLVYIHESHTLDFIPFIISWPIR